MRNTIRCSQTHAHAKRILRSRKKNPTPIHPRNKNRAREMLNLVWNPSPPKEPASYANRHLHKYKNDTEKYYTISQYK